MSNLNPGNEYLLASTGEDYFDTIRPSKSYLSKLNRLKDYLPNARSVVSLGMAGGEDLCILAKIYGEDTRLVGVDISPIADCTKTDVWEIGKELKISEEIIKAKPTDGLWDDGRTDESQLGLKYDEVEDAMKNPNSPNYEKYIKIRKLNLHKMEPIPVCKIPK